MRVFDTKAFTRESKTAPNDSVLKDDLVDVLCGISE
jgi:hypothetical protein